MLHNVFQVSEWETHCTRYAERQVGDYRLRRTQYAPGIYRLYRVDGFTYFHVQDIPIPIMALEDYADGVWREWMIDDPFNYLAIRSYCREMSGRVLTSGLGLGIAAVALAENPEVTDIVVVERSPEVIALIQPYVPERVTILQGDFWEYVQATAPRRGWRGLLQKGAERWDSILLDIWRTKGIKEHHEVMEAEVWPARQRLKALYPDTPMVFFGFAPPTDIDIQLPLEKGRKAREFTTERTEPDLQFAR